MVRRLSTTRGLAVHSQPSFTPVNGPPRPETVVASNRRQNGPETRSKIVIAIDYGTTFTSVAYELVDGNRPESSKALGDHLKRVEVVTHQWPGSEDDRITVPTEILYEDMGSSDKRKRMWFGHQVNEAFDEKEAPAGAFHVRLAKLLLHDAKETERENKMLQEWAQDTGKDEFDFVKDFLVFIKKSLDDYFKEHHSGWLGPNTDVVYIFGCPPAWSIREHEKMAELAKQAGMPPLFMGSEAEALLAVYLAGCEKSSLGVGDAVVICDAGGGTVDLVTVVIQKLEPLEIVHACVSEGITCGGIFIDRRMKELFIKKLEEENLEDFDDIMDDLMKKFVYRVKAKFTGENLSSFEVRGLREDSSRGFRDGRLIITGEEMREAVFDPSVNELVRKALKQISMSRRLHEKIRIKTITLGGGLGGNAYVSQRLKAALAEKDEDIEIQKLPNPGGANVAKGLVLLASDGNLIEQRRSRLNYGLLTYETYDEKMHGSVQETRPEDKYMHGDDLVVKLIDWFLVKGQPIKEKFIIRRRGRVFGVLPDDETVEDELYIYGGDLPTDLLEKKYTLHRDLPEDSDTYNIQADISQLDKDDMFLEEISIKTGLPYYQVDYDFAARHESLDGDSIRCSFFLRSREGQPIRGLKTKTTSLKLVATEKEPDETVLLGSLVSRAERGSHIPQSDFKRGPLFPDRKRKSEELEPDQELENGTDSGSKQPVKKAARRAW